MPPSILQNVVEQVVSKLQTQHPGLQIPSSVIRQAAEKHRLLNTRVRVGSLPGDSSEKRAAVLLEWTMRKETGQRVLSWKMLSAAVHVKKTAALQQLQHVLLNYLLQQQQPILSAAQKISTVNNKSRSLRNRNHAVNYKDSQVVSAKKQVATATLIVYKPKILQELVIRLAGHLVDPHGVQKQVIGLLEAIHGYYDTSPSSATERRGHLYDLQRYAAAYEAAALFHIVSTTTARSSKSRAERVTTINPKPKTKERWSTRNDEALNNSDEEEDGIGPDEPVHEATQSFRPLQLNDLVEASTDFTYLELKQVLPRVQELAEKIAANQAKKERSRDVLNDNPPSSKKQKTTASSATSIDANAILDSALLSSSNSDTTKDDTGYSFDEWKEQVLSNVREEARENCTTVISDEEATKLAADNVLRKYDLFRPQAATIH